MRVNVKKYLIMGSWTNRDKFFERIQQLGIAEFITHRRPSLETPTEIQTYIDALHVLRQKPSVKEVPEKGFTSPSVLAAHVVEREQQLEHLYERSRVLEAEISRIEVFGDFDLSNLRYIEKETERVFQFFFCKRNVETEARMQPEVIYVGSAYGLDYFVAINKEKKAYDGFIEILIDQPLGELHEELAKNRRQIDAYETELATLSHNKNLLKEGLIQSLNRFHLEESKDRVQSLLNGELFAVEGWIPKNKIRLLSKLADELDIYVEPILVEKEDRVPTYLENKGLSRLGEDLINIYDTPSAEDRDPSLWVFIAFGVFFSMIIADAGYGLLLLGLSLWLFFKFRKTRGLGKRIIKLTMALSIGCIIWGTLMTSFFGIELAPDNPLRKASIINWMVEQKASYLLENKPKAYTDLIKDYPELKDAKTPEQLLMGVVRKQEGMNKYVIYNNFTDNVLIEIAIFIGTIHIILSFLRYLDRNWSGIGWVIFMVGAYLYFPLILGALSLIHYVFHVPYELGGMIGKYIMFTGLGLTVVLAIIQKRLGGLGEIMHVIQVFADVMSYLRIYALSLAGMIMAATFNHIGLSVPIYVGIFIIIAGHIINITLALMGGVIHGLRLNFIEWYHYSFEGGGRQFNPLHKIDV